MKGEGIGGRGLVIATVVFVLIAGAIFFAITGGLFGGSEESDNGAAVTDVYDGRSVRMTVEGPIVAEEDRRSYQIEVGTSERTISVMQGYQGSVIRDERYSNNRAAYTEFVHALERIRFGEARTVSEAAADNRGVCADGRRYTFEMLDNGRSLLSLWTTSCSGSSGTLGADEEDLKTLFDRQIPNFRDMMRGVRLR